MSIHFNIYMKLYLQIFPSYITFSGKNFFSKIHLKMTKSPTWKKINTFVTVSF